MSNIIKEDKYEELVEIGKYLASLGLIWGREGNLSARTEKGIIIKATNTAAAFATREDYSLVSLDGTLIRGRQPSLEIKMHLGLYRLSNKINYVFHTHPTYTLACAEVKDKITFDHYLEAKYYFNNPYIPVLPVFEAGSQELAEGAVSAISKGFEAAVLKKHGIVTIGETADIALMRTLIIEKECQIETLSKILKL